MGKPSIEQLEKINRFSRIKLTEDDVYVFRSMMIDNAVTSYYTIVHENLLRKFSADVKRGIALLLSHDSNKLPVGRSFDSMLVEEWDAETGNILKSLYGDFYIPLGRKTESGMDTDDIIRGIDTGTIFDTSIGFRAKSMKCSICGNDIRSWDCPHMPGKEYIVENENGVGEAVTCHVIIGEDGEGELIENSLVYAGACPRATIVNEYSNGNDSITKNMPKLQIVDELKKLPLNASVYQFYTAGGLVLMTDSKERRSENSMEKYTEEIRDLQGSELKTKLNELSAKLDKMEGKDAELAKKVEEIELLNNTINELKETLAAKDNEIAELKDSISKLEEENQKLKVNEELVNTYKNDLKNEIIELGIRSQGNAFNKSLFEKFLDTLSIDELKEVKEGFNKAVIEKYSGVRTTQTKVRDKNDNKELYRDDFETEEEFREYIAGLATEYAAENNVSLKEATKIMYEKYSRRSE